MNKISQSHSGKFRLSMASILLLAPASVVGAMVGLRMDEGVITIGNVLFVLTINIIFFIPAVALAVAVIVAHRRLKTEIIIAASTVLNTAILVAAIYSAHMSDF